MVECSVPQLLITGQNARRTPFDAAGTGSVTENAVCTRIKIRLPHRRFRLGRSLNQHLLDESPNLDSKTPCHCQLRAPAPKGEDQIGSINPGSLFRTLPTALPTFHAFISSAG
jgi:hypothetical protein